MKSTSCSISFRGHFAGFHRIVKIPNPDRDQLDLVFQSQILDRLPGGMHFGVCERQTLTTQVTDLA